MPFRDQASIHINDVLIAVAVDSGEQNIYKKVRVRAWHRLSFLFLESAIKGNIYLYLLELFAFLQIADIKSETEDAVVFWKDGVPFYFNRKMRRALNTLFRNGLNEVWTNKHCLQEFHVLLHWRLCAGVCEKHCKFRKNSWSVSPGSLQFCSDGHSGYASRRTWQEMQDGGLVRLPENVCFSTEGWKESDYFLAYLCCMLGVFYDLLILTVPT